MTEPKASESPSWVVLARLIRSQGRRGEVLAEVLTDFPKRFAALRSVFLRRGPDGPPTAVTLENFWFHKGRVVLKFTHIESISEAESWRGAEMVIPASERVVLEADAVYISDLIGCLLVDVNPGSDGVPGLAREIGTIRDVERQEKTADLLLVEAPDGGESSIPFAKAYVVRMDLANRRLEMTLPPGLLEVNAPLTEEERRQRPGDTNPAG